METITNVTNTVTSAATKAIWGEGESNNASTSTSTKPLIETSTEPTDEPKHEPVTESKDETPSPSAVKTDAPPPSTDKTAGAATSKHEGSDVPQNEPSTKEESSAIKETKAEAEEAAKVVPKGPGPKPLSEVRSGAAQGHAAHDRSGGSGDDDEINEPSHGEGTGEKYVKSTGLKADGGNFDAAAPGAGKEADRLLEEKGIHREPGGSTSSASKGEAPLDDKMTKMSVGDKVKSKMGKS